MYMYMLFPITAPRTRAQGLMHMHFPIQYYIHFYIAVLPIQTHTHFFTWNVHTHTHPHSSSPAVHAHSQYTQHSHLSCQTSQHGKTKHSSKKETRLFNKVAEFQDHDDSSGILPGLKVKVQHSAGPFAGGCI